MPGKGSVVFHLSQMPLHLQWPFFFHSNHQSQWDLHGAGPDCPCAAAAARSPRGPPCQPLGHICESPIPENKLIGLGEGGPPYLFSPSPKAKLVAWQLRVFFSELKSQLQVLG